MAFSWFFILLMAMLPGGSSIKEEPGVSTGDKPEGANEDSSEYNSEEWDEFFKDVQRKIGEEEKEFTKGKRLIKSASTTKQYTRKKSVKRSTSQRSGPLTRARSLSGSLQTGSPWTAEPDAPSASRQRSSFPKTQTTETETLESIRREQQRVLVTHGRILRELQEISAEHKKLKRKYSNLKSLIKGFLSKLSSSSSGSSD